MLTEYPPRCTFLHFSNATKIYFESKSNAKVTQYWQMPVLITQNKIVDPKLT